MYQDVRNDRDIKFPNGRRNLQVLTNRGQGMRTSLRKTKMCETQERPSTPVGWRWNEKLNEK